jgi:hypothetical protein
VTSAVMTNCPARNFSSRRRAAGLKLMQGSLLGRRRADCA